MARLDEQRLNVMNAAAQKEGLGDRLQATPAVIRKVVDADATSGLAITIPYDMYIIDVIVQCNATNASGTLQIQNGGEAVTDAIACDTNHAVDRADSVDDAHADLLTTDTITVVSNGAADRGTVYITGYRI